MRAERQLGIKYNAKVADGRGWVEIHAHRLPKYPHRVGNQGRRCLKFDCIGSLEIHCTHAQYRFGQNSPERLARRQPASSDNASQLPHFIVTKLMLNQ